MTCRPDGRPPDDFEEDIYQTHCYRCGRKMNFVRGKRLMNKVWEEDWILDQEYWTSKAFNELFNTEISIEVFTEPPKVMP